METLSNIYASIRTVGVGHRGNGHQARLVLVGAGNAYAELCLGWDLPDYSYLIN